MGSYKYVRVCPAEPYVTLFSTDPQLVEWILVELKKIIPSYGFVRKTKDLSGQTYECALKHLQGKDPEVWMWIIQQLCLKGWEPFAVSEKVVSDHSSCTYIHFRLESAAEDDKM